MRGTKGYTGLSPKSKSNLWRERNPERNRMWQAKYREANRERLRKASRDLYANPERKKHVSQLARQKKYGLTPEGFANLLEQQEGVCRVCNKKLPDNHTFVAVDHCHKTGKVRGLLHRGCNVAVGAYERHKHQIESYLEQYG